MDNLELRALGGTDGSQEEDPASDALSQDQIDDGQHLNKRERKHRQKQS